MDPQKNKLMNDALDVSEFLDVPGIEGFRVSRSGDVASNLIAGQWKLLKGYVSKRGYRVVNVRDGRKFRQRYVHHLVLDAFGVERPVGAVCRHLDGNPLNNSISNLQWGTHLQNSRDMKSHGNAMDGEKTRRAILTESSVIGAREMFRRGRSLTELHRFFGVAYETLRSAITGDTWSHLPGAIPSSGLSGTKGEKRPTSKMKNHQVHEIRSRYRAGESPSALARELGVTVQTILDIAKRRTWGHI